MTTTTNEVVSPSPARSFGSRRFLNCGYFVGLKTHFRDPQVVHFFGEEYAVYLDEDAQAHAVLNSCPHRGSRLVLPEKTGQVVRGCLRCPYHGYLVSADNGPRLKELQVQTIGVAVFFGFGDYQVDPRLATFFTDPELTLIAHDQARIKVPYERALENALDYDHLLVAHDTTYYGSTLTQLSPVKYQVEDKAIFTQAVRTRDRRWSQILRYPVLLSLQAKEAMSADYYFPTGAVVKVPSRGPDFEAFLSYFPRSSHETLFEQYTFVRSINPLVTWVSKQTHRTVTAIFNEDVLVLNNLCQTSPNQVAYPNDALVNALHELLDTQPWT